MHKPSTFLFSILLITASYLSYAGEKVDKTLDVDANGTLYIYNTRGQLEIEGWDKSQIQVQGSLDDAAKKLIFKRKGHKALIKVLLERGHHVGHGSHLKIFVPRQTQVYFKGVNTDYYISKLDAKLEGHTINGNLLVKDVHADMMLSSVSGQVKVIESSGEALIESVSGKLSFSGEFDKAHLKSMNGNIMANIDTIIELQIENVSGDTAINGDLQNNAKVKLNSVSGDIRYIAKSEFTGECEVASQFGGMISNFLTKDKPWKEKLHKRKLKFVSGDGTGKLLMNTVSGSVSLEQ